MSIEGAAELVEDDRKKRESWEDELRQWFQQGPDDDDEVLVKVHAQRVHAWAEGEELVFEPGRGSRPSKPVEPDVLRSLAGR